MPSFKILIADALHEDGRNLLAQVPGLAVDVARSASSAPATPAWVPSTPGAGHWVQQERPEETLRRLAARARHLMATTKDCHHTKGVEFFLEEVAALPF